MAVNPKLDAAVEIFRELGWDGARPEDIFDLPLGTPEQQKLAKAGLKSGQWLEWDFDEEGHYSSHWVGSSDPADVFLLGAFAVRLGMPAARVFEVIPQGWQARNRGWNGVIVGRLLAEQSEATIKRAFTGRTALWLAEALVQALATHTTVEVPPHAEYLEEWARIANQTLGLGQEWPEGYGLALSPETLQVSFIRHLQTLTSFGGPVYQKLPQILQKALELGWISAEQWREPVLFAIDRSARPIERDLWARILTEVLGADDQWLLDHAPVLLSAMSTGQEKLVARFAPVLLQSGDEDLLLQTLLIGLSVKSAKGKLSVIQQAAAATTMHPPTPENALLLADTLSELTKHKNAKLAQAARSLLEQWQIPDLAEADALAQAGPAPTLGLWRPTPALAPVPHLELGPITAENLSDTLGRIIQQKDVEASIEAERFLALWVALRKSDPQGAAIVTRKMPAGPAQLLTIVDYLRRYPDGTDFIRDHFHRRPLLYARDYAVVKWLDSDLPAVLSTPSFLDWRLDPADLLLRLQAYQQADWPVLEPDLQLAMTRLDLTLLSNEQQIELAACSLPIALLDGTGVTSDNGDPLTVGQVLGQWCEQPLEFPGFDTQFPGFRLADFEPVEALRFLPDRQCRYIGGIPVYPVWTDQVPGLVGSGPATLRWEPNGPCLSAYLLNNVGTDSPARLEDAITAFENGVLHPGMAQAKFLIERGAIQSLAARAAAWNELAQAGLLSVVWPLADEVIGLSAAAGRVWPGTDGLVDLLAQNLDEVRAAIDSGLTTSAALELPGLRKLAAKSSSSRAVKTAQVLVALLPEPATTVDTTTEMSDEEFAAAWPEYSDPDPVPDGATVTPVADFSDQRCQVTLADGTTYPLIKRWYYYIHDHYDLMRVERPRVAPDKPFVKDPHLGYCAETGQLIAWQDCKDQRTEADRVTSQSLVVAYLLHLWLDPENFPHQFREDGPLEGIRATRVRAALPTLWNFPGYDPYKVVRRLPASPQALPVLYPVLVDAITHAAELPGKPPAWLARLLGVVQQFAPVLREARQRGLLTAEESTWPGLAHLAETSPSPAVRKKASALLDELL